ncbi:MAG: FAD:protein FMN transferase [Candidatus Omnitrophica bacterium]|nr:FAD:protein FMN transferase [Candidatus Omnitrophota bacterium]
MGASFTIDCFYDGAREDMGAVSAACWARLEEISREMAAYPDTVTGDISRINASNDTSFEVCKDVFKVLKEAQRVSAQTGGAFDITVYPLVKLWQKAGKDGKLPDKSAIETAKAMVGYKNIELKWPNKVIFKKPGLKLDLGAIAKGFAADEVGEILKKNGIENYCVSAAGSIYCSGVPPGKKAWEIGIQHPKEKDKMIGMLYLVNQGVTTSGNYERFVTIEGQRYSHIIDPRTGYPQKYVISTTIIAPTAFKADPFGSAMCVLGGKEGVKYVGIRKGIQAMVVEDHEGKLQYYWTKGFEEFQKAK